MALLDRLERHLSELESRFSSSRRDQLPAGSVVPAASGAAAAATASAGTMGFDEIATELSVYEKVLQVLSAEANRLQEMMKKSSEQQQQQKPKLEALQSRVSRLIPAQVDLFMPSYVKWLHFEAFGPYWSN